MRVETIRLHEYESVLVDEDLVKLVDESFWADLSVTASRKPKDVMWRLKADSVSGIARYRNSRIDLTVVIEPKLRGADILFLADRAYGQRGEVLRKPKSAVVGINSGYLDPVAVLLMWYVDMLANFATRWLRRSYRKSEIVLSGEVRGRFLVSKYVSQSLATARNGEVPCVVTERTIDTANNRLLKAGLREVAKLSQALPVPSAQRAVKTAVNAVLPMFAGVADATIGPRELRATSTRGAERHYASVLQTTADLVLGRYLGTRTGDSQVSAFTWNMPNLFQEALRGILDEANDFTLDKSRRPTAKIYDGSANRLRSSRIDPDYVLRASNDVILFDAKYKESLKLPLHEDESLIVGDRGPMVQVARSDIYQMAAYRQQSSWLNAKVALVYPVVLSKGQELPDPYEVHGIGDVIHLHFIDIGPMARNNLSNFLERINPVGSRCLR